MRRVQPRVFMIVHDYPVDCAGRLRPPVLSCVIKSSWGFSFYRLRDVARTTQHLVYIADVHALLGN